METIGIKGIEGMEWSVVDGLKEWTDGLFKSSRASGRLVPARESQRDKKGELYTHIAVVRTMLKFDDNLADVLAFYYCRGFQLREISDHFITAALVGDKPMGVLACQEERDERGSLKNPVSPNSFLQDQLKKGLNFISDEQFHKLVSSVIGRRGIPLTGNHPLAQDQLQPGLK